MPTTIEAPLSSKHVIGPKCGAADFVFAGYICTSNFRKMEVKLKLT
jgi:hypothetical protein